MQSLNGDRSPNGLTSRNPKAHLSRANSIWVERTQDGKRGLMDAALGWARAAVGSASFSLLLAFSPKREVDLMPQRLISTKM